MAFSRKLKMTAELPWGLFITGGEINFVGLGDFLEVGLIFQIMFMLKL